MQQCRAAGGAAEDCKGIERDLRRPTGHGEAARQVAKMARQAWHWPGTWQAQSGFGKWQAGRAGQEAVKLSALGHCCEDPALGVAKIQLSGSSQASEEYIY